MKIIFLGTPLFAVPSLKMLVENGYEVAAVITAPDKPAGRGRKMQVSEVKQYAVQQSLKVLQPTKLKDREFLEEVRNLHADLQIVVAFRMMPEELWNMPPMGTFNLHASLLPQYRGAAPIQRAVMNGEKVTGLTTFFLRHEIDTGGIIFRQEIEIGEDETAGALHDRMMVEGGKLVLKTVRAIESKSVVARNQSEFIRPGEILHHAPKIFREDCRLDFTCPAEKLFNQVRGLSPHPGAFFDLKINDAVVPVKVLAAVFESFPVFMTHHIVTDNKTFLKVSAADGMLSITELQWPGKKRMQIAEFLRGFQPEAGMQVL